MSTTLEQLQYGFDRDSRRVWRQRATTQGWDNAYVYDSLSQVIGDDRGDLNLARNAIAGVPANGSRWQYDETGNWHGYQTLADGVATLSQSRTHDKGNRLMEVSGAAVMRTDRAGRMVQTVPGMAGDWSGGYEITWDAWSRITKSQSLPAQDTYAVYGYDGLSRRVMHREESASYELIHTYYNDEWRPVEDRKEGESTVVVASYLWGSRHRDDLVRRDRAVGGSELNEIRYVLMDYFSPAAITDEEGDVTERYQFSAFGLRTILNPDFTVRSESECAMEFSFQGQFEDIETGWMNYGYRCYLPALGRWACKDPIGEEGGSNLYGITNDDSVNKVDLFGLAADVGCLICLYENHYRNQHIFWRGLKSLFKKNQKPGSPVCGYLGCGANKFNDAQQVSAAGGIPNMPRNHAQREELVPEKIRWAEKEGLDLADFQKVGDEAGDLDAAIEAARAKAEEMCLKNCCEAVDIVVRCGGAQAKEERRQRGPDGKSVCGTTVTIPCK